MTSPAPIEQDGNLPESRRALDDAVAALVDPKPETDDGRLVWTDSLYQQLVDAIPGSKRERSGVARSQPPLWIDAQMLLAEIDTEIRLWQRDPGIFDGDLTPDNPPTLPTIRRLHLILGRPWRPQDCRHMQTMTNRLLLWAERIITLLADRHPMHLAAACPACEQRWVYRKDSSGEPVRQPALQIGVYGCECGACHYVWGPERFLMLAEVLGFKRPEGVLE